MLFFLYVWEKLSVKVQDLLGEFLYQNKKLTLPSIGSFEMDASINVYESKEPVLPEGAIQFTQNNQAGFDDVLLGFLVQQSGKMKPLAMSDLDSFISNGHQLLNIGKPFNIKGVGSLTKKGTTFYFEQGAPILEKTEASGAYNVKDRTRYKEEVKELNFDSEEKKGNSKRLMIILASVIALALIGWAVYLALPKNTDSDNETDLTTEDTTTQTINADTTASTPVSVPDTTARLSTALADSSFQVLLFSFADSARANRELAKQLTKRSNVALMQKDSSYQIVLTVKKPLADTAKVMDSLRSYYLLKPKLVKP